MVVFARLLVAILAVAAARAHINSHDNILRIQLWDAEGLSKDPIATDPPTPIKPVAANVRKSKVNLDNLYKDMIYEGFGGNEFGRFTRHKVRHKRRRARQSGTELPWRFHEGEKSLNVKVFDETVPWPVIEGVHGETSAVSGGAEPLVNDVPDPMTLRQDEDEDETVKKMTPVVHKCCSSGQNLSESLVNGKRVCAKTTLSFHPVFYQSNDTHMWSYDRNLFETITLNPCIYDRYKLDPTTSSEDEFYLLVNGTLFAPYHEPPLLGAKEYCMETFYDESNPAGVTLPLVCFRTPPIDEANTSPTLIAYATGLIISVPFLLATAFVYTFITELRDTHGKALACHSTCLAIAFTCLAATQLASHAFSSIACTVMAYLIQFSFVSCFFWLNVMCFDTLLNVRRYINNTVSRRSMRRRFTWYCLYAILLPVILLIVTITMELSPAVPSTYLKPNFGVKGCWFKTDQAALPYFYGPVAAVLLANLVIFLLTSRAFAMHYDKLKDVTALELTHSEFSTSDAWLRFGDAIGETLTRSASPPRESSNDRLKKYQKITRMETDPWLKLERAIGVPIPKSKSTSEKRSKPSLQETTKSLTQESMNIQELSNFEENTSSAAQERKKIPYLNISVRPSVDRMKKYRKLFRTCCMLSVIMGLSWVMEVVSWAAGAGSDVVSVWSVFDVINALQGVVIFVIFVLQQPVRSIVKESRICQVCRTRSGSEVAVVSERTSIDCGTGMRDDV